MHRPQRSASHSLTHSGHIPLRKFTLCGNGMLKLYRNRTGFFTIAHRTAGFALWLFFLSSCLIGVARPASATAVHGSEMPGFGRVVFSFERLPGVEISQVNGVLILNFDAPVDLDLGHLGFEIPNYISAARLDPDKRAVRFALAKTLKPNVLEAGNDLYLDLLPTTWKGAAPGLPTEVVQALSRKARSAEANAQVNSIKSNGTLSVDAASSTRMSRLIFRGTGSDDVKISKKGQVLELAYRGQWQFDLPRVRSELPRGFESIETAERDGNLIITLRAVDGVKIDGRFEDNGVVVDVSLKGVGASDVPLDVPMIITGATLAEPVPARNRELESEKKADKPADPSRLRISLGEGEGALRLLVKSEAALPIASFVRSNRYWLVLDTKIDPEIQPDFRMDGGRIKDFRTMRIGPSYVVSFELGEAGFPAIQKADAGYEISFLKDPKPDTLSPRMAFMPHPSGAMQVGIQLGHIGHRVEVHDPVSNDRMIVVPTLTQGLAHQLPLRFAEFTLLPSSQGVAVVPIADDIEIQLSGERVTISRPEGLAVGDASDVASEMNVHRSVINRARWTRDKAEDVFERKAEFAEKISRSIAAKQQIAWREYARFLAANGLYREAAAAFRSAFESTNETIDAPRDRIELGIYQALGLDWRVATDTLNDIRLTEQEEAILWRGFIAAEQGRFAEALDAYRHSYGILNDYPGDVQFILNRALTEAAIETGDWALAEDRLNALERQKNSEDRGSQDYFKARLLEASGDVENARAMYEKLALSGNRSIEVRAIAARTALDLRFGKIDPAQALSTYENLAQFWRGDFLEAKILVSAARVALDSKKWQNAFSAVQRLNRLYADTDGIRPLLEEVTLKFDGLISGDQSEGLSNLDAVALFMEFREFMPVGHRGDELIRKYIERLIDLDLMSQATELLRYQIDYRLDGVPRAVAAVRLAGLYLLERKPIEAIRALSDTRYAGLPDELKLSRRLVEAQARSDLGETQVASELLEGLESREAMILKGDIFWKSKNWNNAGIQYELALGDVWRKGNPLTPDELKIALRASAAYVLSGDTMSGDRFGRRYRELVAATPDAGVFRLLSAPAAMQAPIAMAVADEKAKSGLLDSFLKSYRMHYGLEGNGEQSQTAPNLAGKPAG